MTHDILQDLLKNKARPLFTLMQEFNRNAGWCGYFFDGVDATMLGAAAHYENTPRHGFHVTTWHRNNGTLTLRDFVRIVTEQTEYTLAVKGYADNGQNQAIQVERAPNMIYLSQATPHVNISWTSNGNAAASGYMRFGSQIPAELPDAMRSGKMKVIMQNNKEMDVSMFRSIIKTLELQRLDEIITKLDPQIRAAVDAQHPEVQPLDTMVWDELKRRFISNGIEFNENMAKLYAQYRTDTTDDKMPSMDKRNEEAWERDAAADKSSDEAWDNAERHAVE